MDQSVGEDPRIWAVVALAFLVSIFVARAVFAWVRSRRIDGALAEGGTHIGRVADVELAVRLTRAGFRSDGAAALFIAVRLGLVGAAAILATILWLSGIDLGKALAVGFMLGVAGYLLPGLWLSTRVADRQQRIAKVLPPLVDLLVLSLESGSGLEAAFERISREIASFEPLMGEEISLVLGEMSAGVAFPKALQRMADRVGIEELTTLATLVMQATQLGASIARTFRDYIDGTRSRRMSALEERAGKISAALTLPVVLCLLPASLVAMVGPAIVLIQQSLGNL